MESIRGKRAVGVNAGNLGLQIAGYPNVLIDLGTGDGRFVRHIATTSPDTFAIGIDLCAANMRERSRRAPTNTLFLVASAYAIPRELYGLATQLTINFPWAELLTGLLVQEQETSLAATLAALCRPGARLEIRLNGEALCHAGWTVQASGMAIGESLRASGFRVGVPLLLGARELRACPTTWSHRLAFGRNPRALYLQAVRLDKGCCPGTNSRRSLRSTD